MKSYFHKELEAKANGIRNLILRVYQKICSKPLALEILTKVYGILLEVAETDNEINALLALQITKQALHISPVISDDIMERMEKFVWHQFEDFPRKIQKAFSSDDSIHNFPGEYKKDGSKEQVIVQSKDSLKIITEIHTIALNVLGVHSNRVKLVPLIVKNVSLMPSVELQRRYKDKFIEFLYVQNKIYLIIEDLLSVLANNEVMTIHAKRLVESSIAYLKNCPPDHGHLRKQFLPILKGLMKTYIEYYIPYLDDLLVREFMIGDPNEWPDVRAEASTLFLSLAQYTKEKLNDEQKEKVIKNMLTIINDVGICISIQANAILTINKYIDIISKMKQHVSVILFVEGNTYGYCRYIKSQV